MSVILFHELQYSDYRGFAAGFAPNILEKALRFHRYMLNHGVISTYLTWNISRSRILIGIAYISSISVITA